MSFADLGDCCIHYQIEGARGAPLLVLSNSLGTDITMWDPQIPAFSQSWRVLRYDTRGHGKSSVPPGPYSIQQLAQDLVALNRAEEFRMQAADRLALHRRVAQPEMRGTGKSAWPVKFLQRPDSCERGQDKLPAGTKWVDHHSFLSASEFGVGGAGIVLLIPRRSNHRTQERGLVYEYFAGEERASFGGCP